MLTQFKSYLEEASKNDSVVAYHSHFITKYGPLLLAFHKSVRYGNAKTREACWLSSLNLFCTLNKKNYKDEAVAHITSFTALWPSAICEMFRKNSSISYRGRVGHNIALDEFVETYMVRPLKLFAKHHSTLSMIKKVNMNLELLTHIKDVFKKSYDVHSRVQGVVPDSLPDRLKIAWFAIQQGCFISQARTCIPMIDHNKKFISASSNKNVPAESTNVKLRGDVFIQKNIKEILYRLFPLGKIKCDIRNSRNNIMWKESFKIIKFGVSTTLCGKKHPTSFSTKVTNIYITTPCMFKFCLYFYSTF